MAKIRTFDHCGFVVEDIPEIPSILQHASRRKALAHSESQYPATLPWRISGHVVRRNGRPSLRAVSGPRTIAESRRRRHYATHRIFTELMR